MRPRRPSSPGSERSEIEEGYVGETGRFDGHVDAPTVRRDHDGDAAAIPPFEQTQVWSPCSVRTDRWPGRCAAQSTQPSLDSRKPRSTRAGPPGEPATGGRRRPRAGRGPGYCYATAAPTRTATAEGPMTGPEPLWYAPAMTATTHHRRQDLGRPRRHPGPRRAGRPGHRPPPRPRGHQPTGVLRAARPRPRASAARARPWPPPTTRSRPRPRACRSLDAHGRGPGQPARDELRRVRHPAPRHRLAEPGHRPRHRAAAGPDPARHDDRLRRLAHQHARRLRGARLRDRDERGRDGPRDPDPAPARPEDLRGPGRRPLAPGVSAKDIILAADRPDRHRRRDRPRLRVHG